jgi:hypothetical protein
MARGVSSLGPADVILANGEQYRQAGLPKNNNAGTEARVIEFKSAK